MNHILLNAYLIFTAVLFSVAFCGSFAEPYKPDANNIRAMIFVLGCWSVGLLIAGQP